MKVSKAWLKELVDLKVPVEELVRLLPLRTIAVKEDTADYFELDMKGYNRADLLSLRGVAYEVGAITESEVKFTEEDPNFPNLPKVNVTVEDNKLAPVYCIAKIENLKVEQSNDTWVKKLNSSGVRSVNNIADVTNLVMLEYGQPLHAFDAAQVTNETIIVRTAKEGEKLTTLDNKERTLTKDDLLITDPKKALGLAGVMGGKNSEVSDSTSTILLEAAIFDPVTLRKTAAKLGLISEASKRFYHGLTKKRLFQALNAAIKMYEGLGGKLTTLTIADNLNNLNEKNLPLPLTQTKINSLIGIDISPQKVEDYLQKLNFTLALQGQALRAWKVTPPYWRLDIGIEEDLIEEVARMYGYEKIPAKPLPTNSANMEESAQFRLIERLKKALYELGLTEVQTYSYYSTQVIQNSKVKSQNLIKIANPISAETEYLRDNLWPNLVEVVGGNVRQGYKDIAIFEIGKIYYKNEKGEAAERYSLAIALMNGTDNPLAELHEIQKKLSLKTEELEKSEYFHPNRVIGAAAEVHKRITDKFGIPQRVAVLEIGLNKL